MDNEEKPVPVVRLELKRVDLKELVRIDDLLGSAPLFRAVGPDGMRRLIEKAVPRRLTHGQAVYRQGEKGNSLFLVLRGEVSLGDDAAEVATVRKGEFFGEGEVLDQKALRACSAIAVGAADVAELPATALVPLVQRHVELFSLLRETHDARAKANTELDEFLKRW